MSAENIEKKSKLLTAWKYLNYVTLAIAIGIGGTLGLSLAAVDLAQIGGIKWCEDRRKSKK